MVKDLPVIYKWVNQAYAIPYWQMNGPYSDLQVACREWLQNLSTHSLVASLDNTLVCQLDIYEVVSDDLRNHYEAIEGDLGMHLLMAPGKKPEASFTTKLLFFLLKLLFCNPLVRRVVCEPDIENRPACTLVERLGFHLEKRLVLPHKTADLYIMSRERFESMTSLN